MIGGRFGDGLSITVLNSRPDGRTIDEDSKAPKTNVVVSDGLLFGAVGVDFVGGIRGTRELVKRVDSKEMACAFSLFPTRIEELMAIADQGQVMPPKSTWFEPKLADGLVSHVLD